MNTKCMNCENKNQNLCHICIYQEKPKIKSKKHTCDNCKWNNFKYLDDCPCNNCSINKTDCFEEYINPI